VCVTHGMWVRKNVKTLYALYDFELGVLVVPAPASFASRVIACWVFCAESIIPSVRVTVSFVASGARAGDFFWSVKFVFLLMVGKCFILRPSQFFRDT
jgi:hypothetical protein